jgi:phospholipid:diacylglycerol acyltransferase
MWGGYQTIQNLILDRFCWLEHMSLDMKTGLDPEGIKLRPLASLESVDYVFPGYWVWAKLILELGEIGYDSNNLKMMSYDWRLGFDQLEERDKYFTILKSEIELQNKMHKKKVLVTSHSLGSYFKYLTNRVLFLYFLQWIQKSMKILLI